MHLDWTITIGNIATILSVLLLAAVIYQKTIDRIEAMERWIEEHQKCNTKQIEVLREVEKIVAYIRGQMAK